MESRNPEQERYLGAVAASQPGVSYNTAWLVKHKLMQVRVERDATQCAGRHKAVFEVDVDFSVMHNNCLQSFRAVDSDGADQCLD